MQPGLALQNALCLLGTKRFACPVVIFPIKICRAVCRNNHTREYSGVSKKRKNAQAL